MADDGWGFQVAAALRALVAAQSTAAGCFASGGNGGGVGGRFDVTERGLLDETAGATAAGGGCCCGASVANDGGRAGSIATPVSRR